MEYTKHARIFVAFTALALVGCSPNSIMKPDCHSCTVEEQSWKEFSWDGLNGKWKGSVEHVNNARDSAKKIKTDKKSELSFQRAGSFAPTQSCEALPANSIVLNGLLWEQSPASVSREYEAFVPVEDGKVAYGRVSFGKSDGKDFCQFRRLGRVMGKNRLNLPSVSFSDRASAKSGRSLASTAPEQEVSVEFLRFAPLEKKTSVFQSDGRGPASAKERERPALMFRVFKVATTTAGKRSEWAGTEEYIYRLWKAD